MAVFLPKCYLREKDTQGMTSCRWRMGAHHLICWKRDINTSYTKDFRFWMELDLQTIYLKDKRRIQIKFLYSKYANGCHFTHCKHMPVICIICKHICIIKHCFPTHLCPIVAIVFMLISLRDL